MNAPDKIVLPAAAGEMQFIIDDTVYIRKDALLEFLANLEKDSARNAGTDELANAAHEMVCLLIDKIKSL